MAVSEDRIISEFSQYFNRDVLEFRDVAQKCAHLCRLYSLSALELAVKFDKHIMNDAPEQKVSAESLDRLKSFIEEERSREKRKRQSNAVTTGGKRMLVTKESLSELEDLAATYSIDMDPNLMFPVVAAPSDDLDGAVSPPRHGHGGPRQSTLPLPTSPHSTANNENIFGSPVRSPTRDTTGHISLVTGEFFKRASKGQRILVYGEGLPETSSAPEHVCPVQLVGDNSVTSEYRFMYQSSYSSAKEISRRTRRMGDAIREHRQLTDREMRPAASVSLEGSVLVYGMVVTDSESKGNAQSLLLQDSLEDASPRLPLNLSQLPSFSLFPGQVVVAEGSNTTGASLLVSNIHTEAPPPGAVEPEGGMKLIIAAGPFTCANNFEYEPLAELIRVVHEEKPHLLLLLGPFVDVSHPGIKGTATGELVLQQSYEEVFTTVVAPMINELETSATRVVLVPSLRDAHHTFIYPQPPFSSLDGFYDEVTAVANPCTLQADDLTIGIANTDVLLHLSSNEVFRQDPSKPSERLPRFASHLINQRSYYPLYPAPVATPVDLQKLRSLEMPVTPNLLIVTSDLTAFAKNLENGTLCINPGRLTKASSAGTYAKLIIHPSTAVQPTTDAATSTHVPTSPPSVSFPHRCRVEIIKI